MRTGALTGVAGFVAGFIVAMLLALAAGWVLFFRGGTGIDISQPTVIQHIQQLQRLETVVYSMEKIVTGAQNSAFLPQFLVGDRLLLIVHGEVTAGVDLAAIDPSTVKVDGKTVSINLPTPMIFSTRIDNARSRVYARETGLFSTPDPQLESEVRRAAERELTNAALDGGILRTAAANARTTLTSLLLGLGFETVNVNLERE
ncbi:MAG TPA: DUF4230 domain-containing protein [Vicinamibacterales bacterium]|jgi:hypothetical protein